MLNIGYVPEGWKRGEPLIVTYFTGGCITAKVIIFRAAGFNPDSEMLADDVVLEVPNDADEIEAAKKWLEWWKGNFEAKT